MNPLARKPEQTSRRGRFADAAIGYLRIDVGELHLVQGKLVMFLTIDRVSRFTYVKFRVDAGKMKGPTSSEA